MNPIPLGNLDNITHVIQLAIAPVFLLNAVGAIIGVLVNRLARVVDRIRALEDRLHQGKAGDEKDARAELLLLGRRLRLINLAIALDVCCALFVGLVIVVAFLDAFVTANLAKVIAGLFIMAMAAFIAALVAFLREIVLAAQSTRNAMR
jgi:hypothetical protein